MFQTNGVRTGRSVGQRTGKAETETDIALFSLAHNQSPLSLFIHTDVCLWREKGQPSSSPERKQKRPTSSDRNRLRSVRQNGHSAKLKVTNRTLFTSQGARVNAVAQGPASTLEDGGGGGGDKAPLQGQINEFKKREKKKSAFGDWLHADRAFEIQNKTVEVM